MCGEAVETEHWKWNTLGLIKERQMDRAKAVEPKDL